MTHGCAVSTFCTRWIEDLNDILVIQLSGDNLEDVIWTLQQISICGEIIEGDRGLNMQEVDVIFVA